MVKVMIIGGTDSSGGAGLTRDTATAAALGVEALPVVTAVTVQTHAALLQTRIMPADLVALQIETILATDTPAAIKIGMLGTFEMAETVASALNDMALPLVIDPVQKSSSGGSLMSGRTSQRLFRQADLITPNLSEAAALTGQEPAQTDADIAAQAGQMMSDGAKAVLIKGGHGTGPTSLDHLFAASGHHVFCAPRLDINQRGTGCTLATSIACYLATGHSIAQSCRAAKAYVHTWLQRDHEKRAD